MSALSSSSTRCCFTMKRSSIGVDLGVESPTSQPAGTDTRPLSICTASPLKASALAIAHSIANFRPAKFRHVS